jgi:hypothetical protein
VSRYRASLAKKEKKQRSKIFGYQKPDELTIVGPEDIKYFLFPLMPQIP